MVSTSKEKRAATPKKYLAEQRTVPNWPKTFQTFRSHSSVFAIERLPKNLNFQSFFTFNRLYRDYFQERRAPTFRKYIAEQGIAMLN